MILEGHNYSISVTEKGAELTSLKKDGVNLLWTKTAPFWQRHAPVLFPIVGKLKDNTYYYAGAKYTLPQHGFARDARFELLQQTDDTLFFRMIENQNTNYPFRYEFYISYTIGADGVKTNYTVENKGEVVLPFSVGAHPGFLCPLLADETLDDYYFEFENETILQRTLLQDGLLTSNTEFLTLQQHSLPLSETLFKDDALVLSGFTSKWVALKSKNYSLKVSWDDCTYLGLWKQPSAPFVCIEPWWGVADSLTHQQDIMTKKGINLLQPGEKGSFWFRIAKG